jgi:hypothetical protein
VPAATHRHREEGHEHRERERGGPEAERLVAEGRECGNREHRHGREPAEGECEGPADQQYPSLPVGQGQHDVADLGEVVGHGDLEPHLQQHCDKEGDRQIPTDRPPDPFRYSQVHPRGLLLEEEPELLL